MSCTKPITAKQQSVFWSVSQSWHMSAIFVGTYHLRQLVVTLWLIVIILLSVCVSSMLCIDTAVGTDQSCSLEEPYGTQLVTLPSLSSASTLKSSSSNATTVTLQPGSEFDSGVDVSFQAANTAAGVTAGGAAPSSGYSGFFEGIFGCLRPVWSVIGKAAAAESKQKGILIIVSRKVAWLLLLVHFRDCRNGARWRHGYNVLMSRKTRDFHVLNSLITTNFLYDLARSKREYCHNCSLVVVLCSFL